MHARGERNAAAALQSGRKEGGGGRGGDEKGGGGRGDGSRGVMVSDLRVGDHPAHVETPPFSPHVLDAILDGHRAVGHGALELLACTAAFLSVSSPRGDATIRTVERSQ